MEDQESSTYWDNIFADWESSGLKQREYCNRNNIKYSVFKKWRYRKKYGLEDDVKTASMLPIDLRNVASLQNALQMLNFIYRTYRNHPPQEHYLRTPMMSLKNQTAREAHLKAPNQPAATTDHIATIKVFL